MNRWTKSLNVLLLTLIGLAPLWAQAQMGLGNKDADDGPKSYQWRQVLKTDGNTLQRLELEGASIARLRSLGADDIRIFNANREALPMALGRVLAPKATTLKKEHLLQAFPILAPVDAVTNNPSAWSLRVEERNGGRVVSLNTGVAGSTAGTNTKVLGVLFDTREVEETAQDLRIDADMPLGLPVQVWLDTSEDLNRWATVGSGTIARFEGENAPKNLTLAIKGAMLKGRYLRLRWEQTGAPVSIRQAWLTTGTVQAAATPVVKLDLQLPASSFSAREISFVNPLSVPIQAMQIQLAEGAMGSVPVRIFGRSDKNEPWRELASTVVFRLSAQEKVTNNAAVALNGWAKVLNQELLIRADANSPGFSMPPRVVAHVAPIAVIFSAQGPGPYELALGKTGAKSIWLPAHSLIPGDSEEAEVGLPVALLTGPLMSSTGSGAAGTTVGAQGASPPVTDVRTQGKGEPTLVQAPAVAQGPTTRTMVLWSVLFLGVAAMAWMAFSIARQMPKPPANEEVRASSDSFNPSSKPSASSDPSSPPSGS